MDYYNWLSRDLTLEAWRSPSYIFFPPQFIVTPQNQPAIDAINAWLGSDRKKGLIILGDSDKDKANLIEVSHLLALVAAETYRPLQSAVKLAETADKMAWEMKNDGYNGLIEGLVNTSTCIDMVGEEQNKKVNCIQDLVHAHWRNGKGMVASTVLAPYALSMKYGAGVTQILQHSCIFAKFGQNS